MGTDNQGLLTLGRYLMGEFENREQAIAEPIWYVHLRLWQRPVSLFTDDGSVTLFAEQASVVKLESPYRQRLMRIQPVAETRSELEVQYYAFKRPERVQGAGQTPELLTGITLDDLDLLPGCRLRVSVSDQLGDRFAAVPPPGCRCYFTYQGEIRQVELGFEISRDEYLTYDKGIDPNTGKALWGAMMGAYRYTKQKAYHF